jgi:hypothetical protein
MANDLHNLNDALAELEKLSVKTSQGSFVKLEDVRRLVSERSASEAVGAATEPKPKTMAEAKAAILKNEDLMKQFPQKKPELGRSLPAS